MSDNKLEQIIIQKIIDNGPMSIPEYMQLCMLHPEYGYYTTNNPISDDFVTAPEVSQMFGEIIAVWIIEAWNRLGKPSPFCLAEIGPGRGTLMNDIVRVMRTVGKECWDATEVLLVEPSPKMTEQQKKLLEGIPNIKWQSEIEFPDMPVVVVANEVLDALPIQQWIKAGSEWKERRVGVEENQKLGFVVHQQTISHESLPERHEEQADGAIFETSSAQTQMIRLVASHINKCQGAALFIDYGHTQNGFGDTLQAVKAHKYVSPLSDAGKADITAHVDFQKLVEVAKDAGCQVPEPTTQSKWLGCLGIRERAETLKVGKDETTAQKIEDDVGRLIGDEETQMGELFKVMGFGSLPISQWHGFG